MGGRSVGVVGLLQASLPSLDDGATKSMLTVKSSGLTLTYHKTVSFIRGIEVEVLQLFFCKTSLKPLLSAGTQTQPWVLPAILPTPLTA